MRAALAARGYAPRHALQAQAIGRVATALFLRTYERAERVHLAMLARGWRRRRCRAWTRSPSRRADALFLAALATPLLADPGRRMSCAIHARDLRFAYPNGVAGARRRRPARRATASASPCSAPTAPARRR